MYCENPAADAAIGYYAALAESREILCNIHTEIPKEIFVDSLELFDGAFQFDGKCDKCLRRAATGRKNAISI